MQPALRFVTRVERATDIRSRRIHTVRRAAPRPTDDDAAPPFEANDGAASVSVEASGQPGAVRGVRVDAGDLGLGERGGVEGGDVLLQLGDARGADERARNERLSQHP